METRLRNYILQNFLFSDNQSALKNTDSFLAKGIIDSTGIMEVINFLQDEFGVQVQDEEMVPANLDSINNILAFLQKKTAM